AAGAQRLGSRVRDPRRQGPPLDGCRLQSADLRPLRPVRLLPLGRPGARSDRRLPRRGALRPCARAGMARRHRCHPGALRRPPVTSRRPPEALDVLDDFGFEAAAIVLGPQGVLAQRGDPDRPRAWRSVTKTLTGYAAGIALQEGRVSLEDEVG